MDAIILHETSYIALPDTGIFKSTFPKLQRTCLFVPVSNIISISEFRLLVFMFTYILMQQKPQT